MSSAMHGLDWPTGFDRTPPDDRKSTSKFSTNFRSTKSDIKTEMERMGVDHWRLDDVTGSGGDPGVVLRWTMDGTDHAVACDAYTAKRDNLRSVYLWVNETRMRSDRPVVTGQSAFAAAELPSGDEEDAIVVAGPGEQPHEILGVAPDAPDGVIRAAAREQKKQHHPDNDGTTAEFQRIVEAEEQILSE